MEAELPRSRSSILRSETNKAKDIKPGPTKHALYLNGPAFEDFAAFLTQRANPSNKDIATELGIGISTVYYARKGGNITAVFASALLKKARGTAYRFEDLVREGEPLQAAA